MRHRIVSADAPSLWLPWLLAALAAGAALGALMSALLWQQVARRQRAESREARARADLLPLHRALRHSSESVVVTDANRRITWVNLAFERVSGYALPEALGRSPAELLQCERTDPRTVDEMRRRLDNREPFVGTVLNRSRSGRLYWLDLDIQPLLDDDGTLTGFVAIQIDITERQQAIAALAASHALLDQTGRIAGVGGWAWQPGATRLQCTRQVRRMFALEVPYCAAARIPDVAPDGGVVDADTLADAGAPRLRDVLRALDRPGRRALYTMVRECLGDNLPRDIELEMTSLAGRRLWVRVHATGESGPFGRRVAGAMVDHTARHGLKTELRRQADLLRGAFEAVDEGLALFDPDDRLVYCNEAYCRLYEAAREVIEPGRSFEEIIRFGAERGQYEAAIGRVDEWVGQRLAAHHAGNRTLVQRLSNGRIVRVVDRKMADGHTVGFRIDITELVRASEAAERADRAKSEFIAVVSHELRTPLQVITGFADLGSHFARDALQPPQAFAPMLDDIHAAGMRMLQLVNGLLDVSKIDGTMGSLDLRRGDVGLQVRSVVSELQPLADARPVRFAVGCDTQTLWASIDAFRLQQVLRNVLANAIRFAPQHSTIEVDGVDLGGGGLEIAVRDHGAGIPPDELESVFEPFVQSSRTRDGSGGTGLGLAISRRIMGAHGGTISAELPADGGTRMRIWLPPLAPAATAPDGPSAPRLLRKPARLAGHAPNAAKAVPATNTEDAEASASHS